MTPNHGVLLQRRTPRFVFLKVGIYVRSAGDVEYLFALDNIEFKVDTAHHPRSNMMMKKAVHNLG